jgi:hypothetical protein
MRSMDASLEVVVLRKVRLRVTEKGGELFLE